MPPAPNKEEAGKNKRAEKRKCADVHHAYVDGHNAHVDGHAHPGAHVDGHANPDAHVYTYVEDHPAQPQAQLVTASSHAAPAWQAETTGEPPPKHNRMFCDLQVSQPKHHHITPVTHGSTTYSTAGQDAVSLCSCRQVAEILKSAGFFFPLSSGPWPENDTSEWVSSSADLLSNDAALPSIATSGAGAAANLPTLDLSDLPGLNSVLFEDLTTPSEDGQDEIGPSRVESDGGRQAEPAATLPQATAAPDKIRFRQAEGGGSRNRRGRGRFGGQPHREGAFLPPVALLRRTREVASFFVLCVLGLFSRAGFDFERHGGRVLEAAQPDQKKK